MDSKNTKEQNEKDFRARLQARMKTGVFGPTKRQAAALNLPGYYGYAGQVRYLLFDGEKNLGELGPIRSYTPAYNALRLRSWQALVESELAQIVIGRYLTWVLGQGMKLQSEPNTRVLKKNKITLDSNEFSKEVEADFSVFSEMTQTDYAGMLNLNTIATDTLKNAIVGGDVLIKLRYTDVVTVQMIDGMHVQTPPGYGSEYYSPQLTNGNRVVGGIELDVTGKHVAYWVRRYIIGQGYTDLQYDRVPARASGDNGEIVMAFMVYGSKYRLDNMRGLPLMSVMLETMKKLERYKEATVGAAEERAKVPYTIEHELGSTGEDPFLRQVATGLGESVDADLPQTIEGEKLASKVAASMNKMVYNLPINAKMKAMDSKQESQFKEFYTTNFEILCASIQIPPNVALQKYDANFSASRAALKDWEQTLKVLRANFQAQFYQHVYNFWLDVRIMTSQIIAPGYLDAKFKRNFYILWAYRKCRFIGPAVPHIDPVKEVTAERLKLGTTGAAIPLTTAEEATENLGGGDYYANVDQYEEELQDSKDRGIEVPAPLPAGGVPVE